VARATIAMTQVIAITKDEPLSSNGPVPLLYFKLDCLLIKGRKLLPRAGSAGLRPACRKLVRLSRNTLHQVARLSRRIRAGGGNCCNLNPNLLETSFKTHARLAATGPGFEFRSVSGALHCFAEALLVHQEIR
jgi:hypothetical protein